MTKTSRTIPIAIAIFVALLVLPASALAEYLVPEGNSAVTQYTEGFPTGGGEKKAGSNTGKQATPAQAIGSKNAKKLEDHGSEGAEVAEVAAETAPAQVEPSETSSGDSGGQKTSPPKSHPQKHKNGGDKKPAKHKQTQDSGKQESKGAAPVTTSSGDGPSGSSGLGEILAAATGSSSTGNLGLLLPLAILAALAWGLVYFFRQRKQAEPPATAKP